MEEYFLTCHFGCVGKDTRVTEKEEKCMRECVRRYLRVSGNLIIDKF